MNVELVLNIINVLILISVLIFIIYFTIDYMKFKKDMDTLITYKTSLL